MSNRQDDLQVDVAVLGGGPGGYTAAFRASDLGLKVALIERYSTLGGVCLNVGCIPSKTLLHAVGTMDEAAAMGRMGIHFQPPKIDLDGLRAGRDEVVKRLCSGLSMLAKQRKVEVVHGVGRFVDSNQMQVESDTGAVAINFSHAIIACGSSPTRIPGIPYDDPRVIDSTGALALADIPQRMLIVGGGIIGMEMAAIYSSLGSSIDIVELLPGLIPGCDRDLVRPLQKSVTKRYNRIMLETRVGEIRPEKDGLEVQFAGEHAPESAQYDKVLVAVGRSPNGGEIGAEQAGVDVDRHGFITVDKRQQTNVSHIYAAGDVTGGPMLAHKAMHEAKLAAEIISGLEPDCGSTAIPAVAYTEPEIAWVGLTETAAKQQGIEYEKGAFPWAANGRAIGIGHDQGVTKLLLEPQSRRLLGAGIVGHGAGELIGELALALDMGATESQLEQIIHPHPSLNETIGLAAEVAAGTITDLMPPRRRR
jgi:dihydrolipoamide dehydrogenase